MHNIKRFADFSKAVEEIMSIVPGLTFFFTHTDEDGQQSDLCKEPDQVVQNIFNDIMSDYPSIQDLEYPRTVAFSISADEVGYKTRGPIAFGWRNIISDHNTLEYSFRISIFSNSLGAKHLEAELNKLGWVQKPYTHLVHTSKSHSEKKSKSQIHAEKSAQ